MTIGEKITSLRISRNMSQSDLAEKLNVSRQSVSKWETDSSIPDLDKLIQLSNIFNITIDELVKSNAAAPSSADTYVAAPPVIVQKSVSTQRIIGFILLGFGLLCIILAMVSTLLLIVGAYSIFCSIMCLTVKNHVGLKIGWFTYLLTVYLAPRFTGIRMFGIFFPGFFRDLSLTIIMSVLMWLILFMLIFFTVRAVKKSHKAI